MCSVRGLLYAIFFSLLFLIVSCNPTVDKTAVVKKDSLTEEQRHLPENALKGLLVAKGLEVQPVASEPMLKNPTNIDIDHRGRIWVVEAYNYRPKINGNPVNPKGDRIVIIEDINAEGHAGKSKVFYQGPELNAPLGICVLGDRVLVSQSPYVWAFYDDNGDDSADRKEILFQGIGGEQHDHGMHTFTFGPDGKLYFNFGNEGRTLKDKNGKTVRDQNGDEIGPKKYRQGMVFRCNPDGSQVECLGSNFRNNYEVAVDSYGTMWQSDNDDDGNKGVRINYVMEYGNYGYHDEVTDAAWQVPRTNIEDSIYDRHWHQNDPGIIPNLLHTGAGSPTGMIIYEGALLPQEFQGQMIHCEPGANVVRSYPVVKDGAGYKASIVNILHDDDDQWFRPADVCTAPDGSIMIADWYDPIVGGHGAGDQDRGRIYRIAPAGSKFSIPQFDFDTPAGAVAALQNPNLATRFLAWTALQKMGKTAVPELEKLWHSNGNTRLRARALWVLSKMQTGSSYINEAIKDGDPNIRITGLRAARQISKNILPVISSLVNDSDPQVRRECAIALRHNKSPEAPKLWATLAMQYQGNDRWYLEALGIGADRQWDRFFSAYLAQNKQPLETEAGRDIVWRSRGDNSLDYLAKLASDSNAAMNSRLRYFRSFDFHTGSKKSQTLLKMLADKKAGNTDFNLLVLHHLDPAVAKESSIAKAALEKVLQASYGSPAYISLVKQYKLKSENPRLQKLALARYNEPEGVDAVRLLIESGDKDVLQKMLGQSHGDTASMLITVLGRTGYTESIDLLQDVLLSNKYDTGMRSKAAQMIGKSYGGEDRVIDLLKDNMVPTKYIPAVVNSVKEGQRSGIYKQAVTYLPGANKVERKPVPTVASLMELKGDAGNGMKIFQTVCSVCHQVKGNGTDFGPKLSEIGSKLPREALFKSIVSPSSAISFGYETSLINLKNGTKATGIIFSKTDDEIDLKYPGGTNQQFQINDVKNIKELPESLMPEMSESLSNQDIADVVEYLKKLTKK